MPKLPKVVFGATCLGNLFHAVDDAEKSAIVSAWLAAPYMPVVIDSAGKYGAGLALEVLGVELDRAGVSPSQVLVSNKLGWRRIPLTTPEPTFEPGAWVNLKYDAVQDISYDGILRCWEEGSRLLGGFAAQLLSVHDPDEYLAAAIDASDRARRRDDIIGAYRALTELRRDGKVLASGIGCKDWTIIRELAEDCDFDWVMLANSFTIMRHPAELNCFISQLASDSISVINSALFHGGFLLGGKFFDYKRVVAGESKFNNALGWRQRFHDVCGRFDISPFTAGVAFGRSHPGICSIALSTSRAERVASHIAATTAMVPLEFWVELKSLGLLDPNYPYLGV